MNNLRVVVDTSVVVSALLLPRSVPRQAFDRALELGRILISAESVNELNAVLRRPKFDKYLTEENRLEFLAALVRSATQIEIAQKISVCRDPKDDFFLELAVNGGANFLISGDADLLTLNPFRDVKIITPLAFLALFPRLDDRVD